MAKRYLVTGSNGYIARHLIEKLIPMEGAAVYGVDVRAATHPKGWHAYQGDLLHPNFPKLLGEIQPDVIFHTAAAPRNAAFEEQLRLDAVGTEFLLKSLLDTQIDARVVVLGSAAEYGLQPKPIAETAPLMPAGEYGIAKEAQSRIALLYAERYHVPVIIGRIFNLYGGTTNTLAIAALASQIARQEMEMLNRLDGGGKARIKAYNLLGKRDFIYVNDAVRALIALAEHGRPGEVYNIGCGEAVSIQAVLDKLLALSRLENVDILPAGEQTEDMSEALIAKITNETGWHPAISLDQGLKRELAYWRDQAAVLPV